MIYNFDDFDTEIQAEELFGNELDEILNEDEYPYGPDEPFDEDFVPDPFDDFYQPPLEEAKMDWL